MKRKDYEKPTLNIVVLRQESPILTASPFDANTGLLPMDDPEELISGTGLFEMGDPEDL